MTRIRRETDRDAFLAIVCADDDLVRAEFNAIIDASWGDPPPTRRARQTPPRGRPGRSRLADPSTPMPRRHDPHVCASARQRSPPCGGAAFP
jgi:hypothetical protein